MQQFETMRWPLQAFLDKNWDIEFIDKLGVGVGPKITRGTSRRLFCVGRGKFIKGTIIDFPGRCWIGAVI